MVETVNVSDLVHSQCIIHLYRRIHEKESHSPSPAGPLVHTDDVLETWPNNYEFTYSPIMSLKKYSSVTFEGHKIDSGGNSPKLRFLLFWIDQL